MSSGELIDFTTHQAARRIGGAMAGKPLVTQTLVLFLFCPYHGRDGQMQLSLYLCFERVQRLLLSGLGVRARRGRR